MISKAPLIRGFERRAGHSSLPIDLVIVRNGVSQGVVALNPKKETWKQSRLLRKSLAQVHASKWRLTSFGRSEARAAGEWINSQFPKGFDAYLTGEYVRSLETACCLDLPDAKWLTSLYLRPRDFGAFAELDRQFNEEEFKHHMAERARDSFYWAPPNGESIAHLTLRTERIIHWIRCHVPSTGSAIIVTHKDVMETLRIRIERISQGEYAKKIAQPPTNMLLHHCSVLQYTRRNPQTGEVVPRYQWMRVSTPWFGKKALPEQWEKINPKQYGNEEVMEEVRSIPNVFTRPRRT